MKKILLVLSVFCIFACKNAADQSKSKPEEMEDKTSHAPEWLVGSWQRTGEKEGTQTYEYWSKNKDGQFIGMGCTLKNGDTVWREDVLLFDDKDDWKFDVRGMGDTISTVFQITAMMENKFVCENQENDFPKKIEYVYDGKNINAMISGGGPDIPFYFIPLKQ